MSRERTKERGRERPRARIGSNEMLMSIAVAVIMTSSAVAIVLMDDNSPMEVTAAGDGEASNSAYTIRDVLVSSVIKDGMINKDMLIAEIGAAGDSVNLIFDPEHVSLIIPNEIFDPLNLKGKTLRLLVRDDAGNISTIWIFDGSKEYDPESRYSMMTAGITSSFDGSNMPRSARLNIERYIDENDMPSNAIYINLDANGVFPYKATIRHHITDEMRITSTFSMYYYNPMNGNLIGEGGGYTVDEDGFVTIEVEHASSYLLVAESAPMISIWTVMALVVIAAVAMIEISIVKRWRSE